MADFKPSDFRIKDESKDGTSIRVVKLDTGPGPQVRDFKLQDLAIQGKGNYEAVKGKYGALAATDPDRHSRSARDSRFSVSPLLRDPLAIEDEERRVIEKRVEEQLRAVSEQARLAGDKRGYEDGLKKGHDEAFEQYRGEAAQSLESLKSFVQAAESLKEEIFKANERFLIELVFQVAKAVTLKELSTDQDYVQRLARDLLQRIGIRENVTIRLNPKDAASIDTLKAELLKSFSDLKNLHIEISEEVQGGGCAIETEWSAIDASIETQLKLLRESLTAAPEKPKHD